MNDPVTIGLIASAVVGALIYLIKMMIEDFKKSISGVGLKLEDGMKRTEERIAQMEEKHDKEIREVHKELGNIKGDFCTSFVLREDYFRSMNAVEDRMKSIDSKLDKLLLNKRGE